MSIEELRNMSIEELKSNEEFMSEVAKEYESTLEEFLSSQKLTLTFSKKKCLQTSKIRLRNFLKQQRKLRKQQEKQ